MDRHDLGDGPSIKDVTSFYHLSDPSLPNFYNYV